MSCDLKAKVRTALQRMPLTLLNRMTYKVMRLEGPHCPMNSPEYTQ